MVISGLMALSLETTPCSAGCSPVSIVAWLGAVQCDAAVAASNRTPRAASRSMRRTPLTIKIRMGFTDDPTRYVAWDVVRRARSWGAAAVTLHGRTRAQRYSRLADWGYIQKCADAAESGGAASASASAAEGEGDVDVDDDGISPCLRRVRRSCAASSMNERSMIEQQKHAA